MFMQLAGDVGPGEHARGAAVDEHLDHRSEGERLIARATAAVADKEGARVERIDGVTDGVEQVV